MSQHTHHLSDDTSDRLYTPEELASYAAAEARRAEDAADRRPGPARPAERPALRCRAHRDPAAPGAARRAPGRPVTPLRQVTPAAGPPAGPRRDRLVGPAQRPASRPLRRVRPAVRPPARHRPPRRPAHRPGPPTRGRHRAAPLHDRDRLPRPPGRRGGARPGHLGLARPGPPLERRLDQRRGWAPAERAYEQDRALIQKDFDGPVTIAFINPKGGAAKTTGVLAAGYTFGTVRGGGVVAWDNNETRGTLGIRGSRSSHTNTTKELLDDLGKFSDVYQSRIGDLGSYVRSQGDAHFDVLASDESPNVTGQIHADDFNSIHQLLSASTGSSWSTPATTCGPRTGWPRPTPPTCSSSPPRSARTPATAACGCSTRSRTPATRTSSTRRSRCSPTPRRPWTPSWPPTWSTSTSSAPAGSTACPTTRRWSPARCCPTTSSRRAPGCRWLRACAGMASAL